MAKTNTVILHFMHVYGEKCFNGVEYKLNGAIYWIIWSTKHHSVSSSMYHVCYLYVVMRATNANKLVSDLFE
jgi:hypothetical protein